MEIDQHRSTNIRTINFLINWIDHDLIPNLKITPSPDSCEFFKIIKEYAKWMEDDVDSDDTNRCKEWINIQREKNK